MELEALKDMAPREASVFFLMGRIYKKLNEPNRAMVNFSIALDLKPSSSDVNLIKARTLPSPLSFLNLWNLKPIVVVSFLARAAQTAVEKLNVPDDLEDEEL